jgi:hypothetical protein
MTQSSAIDETGWPVARPLLSTKREMESMGQVEARYSSGALFPQNLPLIQSR